jgi:hypothetical protein
MKTKSVLLAVMMSASLVALANEPGNPRVRVVNQKESGIYRLTYAGSKSENVKLNILNDAGQVLFSETIRTKEGFIRSLNFTGVGFGEYTVKVVSDGLTEVSKVNYLATSPSATSYVHVAKTGEEGKYLFTVSNAVDESINVKIYDGLSNLVHDEMLKVNGSYGLVYNLKQIAGNPTFEVTDKAGITRIVK